MKTFTITEEHLILLRRAFMRWDDSESGAPAIDPKRPYGNSDVPGDVIEILGWSWPESEPDYDGPLSDALREKAFEVHRETEWALQILIQCHQLPLGEYVQASDGSWGPK